MLLELVTAEQAVLLGLVEVPEGQRASALERLRREPTGDTAAALVKAGRWCRRPTRTDS